MLWNLWNPFLSPVLMGCGLARRRIKLEFNPDDQIAWVLCEWFAASMK